MASSIVSEPDTAAGAFPLDRPLPPDAFTRSRSGITAYRSFPVFSWPWFWRRAAIFGPIAGALSAYQSISLIITLKDVSLGLLCALWSVPIWLAIMTAGPAFASIVRHARLRPRAERAGIIVAIGAGLVVSMLAQVAAEKLSNAYITPRAIEAGLARPDALTRKPNAIAEAFQRIGQLIIFFGLGGGPALRAYFVEQRRWREGRQQQELEALRRQKSEADMRLTVLQAQVEPHFLFNTLASVRSLVQQDPQRAEATIDALVDHLRATMPKLRAGTGALHHTLAQQIEICASYLALMQVRMGERLRFRIEVPQAMRALAFPPLILISLVENSIKHGIEPKSGGGSVTIRAELAAIRGEPQIIVNVVDDGLGLRPGLSDGVGLSNVRSQLATLFGHRAALSLAGREGGGVIATVRVPCTEAVS